MQTREKMTYKSTSNKTKQLSINSTNRYIKKQTVNNCNGKKMTKYYFDFSFVYGSTNETIIYLFPFNVGKPSCKCVKRPGWIIAQPRRVEAIEQL